MSTDLIKPASQEFLQSLARGLAVIRAFGAGQPRMTLSDVARKTGVPRAAVRRCLLTLMDLGYVEAHGQQFQLRPRVLDLGYAFLSSLSFWDGIQPILERLVDRVGESCSVSVLDGPEIVYVVRVPVKRIITPTISIGTRLPAYATAMGQVLLAGLDEAELEAYLDQVELKRYTPDTIVDRDALLGRLASVRSQGYAVVSEELERGLSAVAVPLRDRHGRTVAVLGESLHSSSLERPNVIGEHVEALNLAAEEASLLLR